MIRKLMLTGMLITFLSATTCVFAEDVYITQKGSKYHKEICRLIKNKDNITKIEKKQAIEDDYGPCGRCFKEDAVTEGK
jgi:cytidine deaminase